MDTLFDLSRSLRCDFYHINYHQRKLRNQWKTITGNDIPMCQILDDIIFGISDLANYDVDLTNTVILMFLYLSEDRYKTQTKLLSFEPKILDPFIECSIDLAIDILESVGITDFKRICRDLRNKYKHSKLMNFIIRRLRNIAIRSVN